MLCVVKEQILKLHLMKMLRRKRVVFLVIMCILLLQFLLYHQTWRCWSTTHEQTLANNLLREHAALHLLWEMKHVFKNEACHFLNMRFYSQMRGVLYFISFSETTFCFLHHSGIARLDNWRSEYSYIVFCLINFFWNPLFLWSLNTNI